MTPSIPVLPVLDVHRGILDFRLNGVWRRYCIPNAAAMAAALSKAVGSPRWDAEARSLTVLVPQLGSAAGQERVYKLSESIPMTLSIAVMA